MNLNDVVSRFTLLSGFSSEKISAYLPIVRDCMAYFASRMNRDYSEAEKKRLSHACAVYALYKISLCPKEGEFSSFRAGDVQFSTARVPDAEKLWENEKAEIADLILPDEDFLFRGVRI